MIVEGGKYEFDIEEQVRLTDKRFELHFYGLDESVVTIWLDDLGHHRIRWNCSTCDEACEHVGAAFSLILENKMSLGLAAPPDEQAPIEALGEEELVARALAERAE